MDKLKKFFNISYSKTKTKEVINAMGFILLAQCIANIIIIPFMINTAIPMMNDAKAFIADAPSMLEEGLELKIEDGKLISNKPGAIILGPLPEEAVNDESNQEKYEYILTIDTNPELDLEDALLYPSPVIITDTQLIAKDGSEIRMYPLETFDGLVINKENLTNWAGVVQNIIPWITAGILALIFAFTLIGSLVFFMLISLFGAILVKIIGAIRKIEISFKDAYVLSLYSCIILVAVDLILMMFGIWTSPAWIALILLLVVVAIQSQSIRQ